MKKIESIYKALILSAGLAATGPVHAQYPVQVVPQLLPPYSLQLSDYYSGTVDKLAIMLTDRDLNRASLNVRLQLSIAGQNATITSKPNVFYPPITLDAGVPVRVSGSELAPYFNPDNLDFQGITRAQYQQSGKIPEGFYQFCIQAIETTTGRAVSQSSCAMAWMSLSDPPLLNTPAISSNVVFRDPLNLLFTWTPRNMSSPNSAFNTAYTFQLLEVTDTAIDPSAAFQMYPVLYETEVQTTTFLYGPGLPPLLNGKRYAWRVQAHARSNGQELDLYRNNGYSAVNWFLLEDNCLPPQQSFATIQGGGVHISWLPQSAMSGYEVDYRIKGQDNAAWFTQMSTDDSMVLYDVKPGQSYEYRIGGSCSVGGGTTYGDVMGFTVAANDPIGNPRCGILPNINITNQALLPVLAAGDVFKAGDFPVKVLQAAGQGSFTGNGYVTVPFLGQAMVKVRFSQIGINTDRQLVRGVVITTLDSTMKQVANADTVRKIFGDLATVVNDLVHTAIDDSYPDFRALKDQVAQMVAQQMPESLVNKMDSALSDLDRAKLSYDSARAAYDSLPSGPDKDQARQDMNQARQDYKEAQQEVNEVAQEQQALVKNVSSLIVAAIQQLQKDYAAKSDSAEANMAALKQQLTRDIYTDDGITESGGLDDNAEARGGFDEAVPADSIPPSLRDFAGRLKILNSKKGFYKMIRYVLAFNQYYNSAGMVADSLGTDTLVSGGLLIKSVIEKQQAGVASDDIITYIKQYFTDKINLLK